MGISLNPEINLKHAKTVKIISRFYSTQCHFSAIQALKALFIDFLLHGSFHLYILRAEI
jgi:hypothetical protein